MGLTKKDSLAIKGIAILIMLFHHLYCDTGRFEGYTISFAPFRESTVVSVAFLFKICVSIFAFITGYGLLKSISRTDFNRKAIVKWNVNRIIKTLSGFWFVYIIAFIVTQIINGYPVGRYFTESNLNGIAYAVIDFLGLANLLDTPTLCGTWWYMSAAIIFILIIPIVYAVSKKIGYLPILIIITAVPRLLNIGFPGGTNIYTFITPVIFGMICADYNVFEKIEEKSPKNKVLAYILHLVIFGGILALGIIIPYIYKRNVVWEFTYGVVPVIFICLFRFCIIRLPIIRNVLEFLGERSMTIFLSHTFLRVTYLNEFIYTKGHFIVIFLVLLALSLALGCALDLLKWLCQYDKLIGKLLKKINAKFDAV